jgi:hypothetical protein
MGSIIEPRKETRYEAVPKSGQRCRKDAPRVQMDFG